METGSESTEVNGGMAQSGDQSNGALETKPLFLVDDSSELEDIESMLCSSKQPICIGNIELLENTLNAWKNQSSDNDSREKEINIQRGDNEIIKKGADEKIADLEKTVELMQRNIDALYNDLNWIDKLHKDIHELNEKNAELKDQLQAKVDDYNRMEKENADGHQNLLVNHEKELEQLKFGSEAKLEKVKTEYEHLIKIKNEEIKHLQQKLLKHEKDKESEVSVLKMEYENKLRKLQQKKIAQPLNQQQPPAFNQDIYRKKLQHLKTEYEQENTALKNQVKFLQQQLNSKSGGRK